MTINTNFNIAQWVFVYTNFNAIAGEVQAIRVNVTDATVIEYLVNGNWYNEAVIRATQMALKDVAADIIWTANNTQLDVVNDIIDNLPTE